MGILARNEVCRNCAKCCKEFTISGGFGPDFRTRIRWLQSHPVGEDGLQLVTMDDDCELRINIPCTMLSHDEKTGLYSCAYYDNPDVKRPQLCIDYPDNVPVLYWEKEAKRCPIIKEWHDKMIAEQKKTEG
jgi:Fe-S-cluster containining protein